MTRVVTRQLVSFGRAGAAALLLVVAIVAAAGMLWLRAQATQAVPVAVAERFVERLGAGDFVGALALTDRSAGVGSTAEELQRIASSQMCGGLKRVPGTGPPQSNGNRLRRRLSGAEIEMPEVQVEFAGNCLLGVTVRHVSGEVWRVRRFASHAG